MVALQVDEHLGELGAERVEFGFAVGPNGTPAPAHQRVKVGRKRNPIKPGSTAFVENYVEQVLVVEIAMRHRHGFPPVLSHDRQGRGMVGRRKEADFATDQLGMS
ncbi:MAG: hypothetical protein Q8M65_01855, partial [Rhodoglobus sp.]|nr:hypothetical protein [Rhodoglobus sp.]